MTCDSSRCSSSVPRVKAVTANVASRYSGGRSSCTAPLAAPRLPLDGPVAGRLAQVVEEQRDRRADSAAAQSRVGASNATFDGAEAVPLECELRAWYRSIWQAVRTCSGGGRIPRVGVGDRHEAIRDRLAGEALLDLRGVRRSGWPVRRGRGQRA